ncbi:MAG: hypothetical protein MJZ28_02725 [Paludibacteraceae bacterium]|nr:hypothetical protein [Paludibacteraceae bacterium]
MFFPLFQRKKTSQIAEVGSEFVGKPSYSDLFVGLLFANALPNGNYRQAEPLNRVQVPCRILLLSLYTVLMVDRIQDPVHGLD